ncbi:MAG: 2-dehydropantoate 2-reductase [Acidobacteriaceae bacterium]|nr:2-dehydropantoate 2-reductase [Acidobacteriaceae bacterium]
MKTVILGAGAMGSALGGALAKAGNEVVLVEVAKETIDAVNSRGLIVQDKTGHQETVKIPATDQPASVGSADLVVVFVKCYHTEDAVRSVTPIIGPTTTILSLQNGWGNGPTIGKVVGLEKVLLGVSYHSATLLGPGHVLHAGQGNTFIGELDGTFSERLTAVAKVFNAAGINVTPTGSVLKEIWSKLALNAVTLPTSAAIQLTAERLLDAEEMQQLMKGILKEVVAVAQAQKIALEFDERWQAISGLLGKLAANTKGSMLQDVERKRRTEIDVINGAVVEAGKRLGIPTPYNNAMLWLIKALERSFRP